jgi:hypothetical protein
VIPRREHTIKAQKTLFDAFEKRTLHIKFWSRHMMTPREMQRLYDQLDRYQNALQMIASTDVLKSGDIARKALGIIPSDPTQ